MTDRGSKSSPFKGGTMTDGGPVLESLESKLKEIKLEKGARPPPEHGTSDLGKTHVVYLPTTNPKHGTSASLFYGKHGSTFQSPITLGVRQPKSESKYSEVRVKEEREEEEREEKEERPEYKYALAGLSESDLSLVGCGKQPVRSELESKLFPAKEYGTKSTGNSIEVGEVMVDHVTGGYKTSIVVKDRNSCQSDDFNQSCGNDSVSVKLVPKSEWGSYCSDKVMYYKVKAERADSDATDWSVKHTLMSSLIAMDSDRFHWKDAKKIGGTSHLARKHGDTRYYLHHQEEEVLDEDSSNDSFDEELESTEGVDLFSAALPVKRKAKSSSSKRRKVLFSETSKQEKTRGSSKSPADSKWRRLNYSLDSSPGEQKLSFLDLSEKDLSLMESSSTDYGKHVKQLVVRMIGDMDSSSFGVVSENLFKGLGREKGVEGLLDDEKESESSLLNPHSRSNLLNMRKCLSYLITVITSVITAKTAQRFEETDSKLLMESIHKIEDCLKKVKKGLTTCHVTSRDWLMNKKEKSAISPLDLKSKAEEERSLQGNPFHIEEKWEKKTSEVQGMACDIKTLCELVNNIKKTPHMVLDVSDSPVYNLCKHIKSVSLEGVCTAPFKNHKYVVTGIPIASSDWKTYMVSVLYLVICGLVSATDAVFACICFVYALGTNYRSGKISTNSPMSAPKWYTFYHNNRPIDVTSLKCGYYIANMDMEEPLKEAYVDVTDMYVSDKGKVEGVHIAVVNSKDAYPTNTNSRYVIGDVRVMSGSPAKYSLALRILFKKEYYSLLQQCYAQALKLAIMENNRYTFNVQPVKL